MKKTVLIPILFLFVQSIFAVQWNLKSNLGYFHFIGKDFCFAGEDTVLQIDNFGLGVQGNILSGSNFDLEDIKTNIFKAEEINVLNCNFSTFYKTDKFFIQPYFGLSKITALEGKIYLFNGDLSFPIIYTYGSKIKFHNHQIDLTYLQGNGYFEGKKSELPEDIDYTILSTTQSMLNARYDFIYSNKNFSLDAFINYFFMYGNFDGIVTPKRIPTFRMFPFNELSYTGNDVFNVFGLGGNINWDFRKIEFSLTLANLLIFGEKIDYQANFSAKTDLISRLFLLSAGLSGKSELEGSYDELNKTGLFYTSVGFEYYPFGDKVTGLFVYKPIFIPYRIGGNTDSVENSENIVELVLTTFSLGVLLQF